MTPATQVEAKSIKKIICAEDQLPISHIFMGPPMRELPKATNSNTNLETQYAQNNSTYFINQSRMYLYNKFFLDNITNS
jgi:hypothetical protein